MRFNQQAVNIRDQVIAEPRKEAVDFFAGLALFPGRYGPAVVMESRAEAINGCCAVIYLLGVDPSAGISAEVRADQSDTACSRVHAREVRVHGAD